MRLGWGWFRSITTIGAWAAMSLTATAAGLSAPAPAASGTGTSGLKNGTRCYFTVKAINAAGIWAASNQASTIPVA